MNTQRTIPTLPTQASPKAQAAITKTRPVMGVGQVGPDPKAGQMAALLRFQKAQDAQAPQARAVSIAGRKGIGAINPKYR